MKNLTDFCKTVETGVDPYLSINKSKVEEMHFRAFSFSLLLARTLRGKMVLCPTHPLIFKTLKATEKKNRQLASFIPDQRQEEIRNVHCSCDSGERFPVSSNL